MNTQYNELCQWDIVNIDVSLHASIHQAVITDSIMQNLGVGEYFEYPTGFQKKLVTALGRQGFDWRAFLDAPTEPATHSYLDGVIANNPPLDNKEVK